MGGSIIDPVAEERRRLVRRILAAAHGTVEHLDRLGAMGLSPSNDMMIQQRLDLLIDFLIPRHDGDVTANPPSDDYDDTMPSSIERLKFEDDWHQLVRKITGDMVEEAKKMPGRGGLHLPPSGNVTPIHRNGSPG